MTTQSVNCIETAKGLANQASDVELELQLNALLSTPARNAHINVFPSLSPPLPLAP